MGAFSSKETSPGLSLSLYLTFNRFREPEAGSPPKLST